MLLPWLARHVGWVVTRFAVKKDGLTAYRRLRGREYRGLLVGPMEGILYRKQGVNPSKLEASWDKGVWLGKKSDTGTSLGQVVARTLARRPDSRRWQLELLQPIVCTPWEPWATLAPSESGEPWTARLRRSWRDSLESVSRPAGVSLEGRGGAAHRPAGRRSRRPRAGLDHGCATPSGARSGNTVGRAARGRGSGGRRHGRRRILPAGPTASPRSGAGQPGLGEPSSGSEQLQQPSARGTTAGIRLRGPRHSPRFAW